MPSPAAHSRTVRLAAREESRRDRLFTEIAGVPEERSWWALRHEVSPAFAGAGYRSGQSPQAVAALGAAMEAAGTFRTSSGLSHTPDWQRGETVLTSVWEATLSGMRTAMAVRIGRADWAVAALCVAAGLEDPDLIAWLLTFEAPARRDGAGLDAQGWVDVAMCLSVEMSPAVAVAHVLAGRDMEPVRLVAALT